eukprot:gnl/MRDRNA2_/MRDRNA2_112194_c0_seq1.p1 gnl/MRDRNA2_/MRDRNA2_112194_c0~~gnl/MRDRNA2_/MRDRNA2_112194_c0_seq1.p1  ORF type:complete len:476 (-),score=71.13 gnl/MRDRNA2_/MRDRNA2_112194_c0_seq1:104-1366(-)
MSPFVMMYGPLEDRTRPVILHQRGSNVSSAVNFFEPVDQGGEYSLVVLSSVHMSDDARLKFAQACMSLPLGSVCVTATQFKGGTPAGLLELSKNSFTTGFLGFYIVAPRLHQAVNVYNMTIFEMQQRALKKLVSSVVGERKNIAEGARHGFEVPGTREDVALLDSSDVMHVLRELPILNLPPTFGFSDPHWQRMVQALARSQRVSGKIARSQVSFKQLWWFIESGLIGSGVESESPLQSLFRSIFVDELRNLHAHVEGKNVERLTDEAVSKVLARLSVGRDDIVLDISAGRGRNCLHMSLVCNSAKVVGLTSMVQYAGVAWRRMNQIIGTATSPVSFHSSLDEVLALDASVTVAIDLRGIEEASSLISRLNIKTGARIAVMTPLPSDFPAVLVAKIHLRESWGLDGLANEDRTVLIYVAS